MRENGGGCAMTTEEKYLAIQCDEKISNGHDFGARLIQKGDKGRELGLVVVG